MPNIENTVLILLGSSLDSDMGTTETEVPLYISLPVEKLAITQATATPRVRRTVTGTVLPGLPEVARKTRKPLTAEELEERRKKVQTRYNYSGNPLIRTALLPNSSVIREVSFIYIAFISYSRYTI